MKLTFPWFLITGLAYMWLVRLWYPTQSLIKFSIIFILAGLTLYKIVTYGDKK